MDMNKVKPYLFWVICGAILVLELVYFGFILKPSPPDASTAPSGLRPPQDAEAAQREAKNRLRDLDALKERAENTLNSPPQEVVMDPAEAEGLKKYIVSQSWEGLLRRQEQDRQERVADISRELSSRSAPIHQPVSGQTDPVAWYADYQTASAALIRFLVDEGVIIPPGNMASEANTTSEYRTNRQLRGMIGLVTADGNEAQFEDPGRREQVSREFRMIDILTRRLAAVRVTPDPHPLAASFEEVRSPVDERVTIRSLTIARTAQQGNPTSYQVRLELTASPAALLAASRQIDSTVEPITVRLGSRWTRRDFGLREKHNVADVPMDYSVDLLILDFYDPALRVN